MSYGYVLTGKRGDGKSLAAVGKAEEYLQGGRPVATNMNLFPEKLLPPDNRTARIYRLPDHPQVADLEMLPPGNLTKDGELNGLLIFDEAATMLNSRTWNENGKARQALISWLLHSRKYGWDLIFITQHLSLLDKQIRDSLFEFHGVCKSLDKVAIPVLTPLGKIFGLKIRPPKMHICIVRYGLAADAPVSDKWIYRSALYQAYDTNQVIDPATSPGLHTLLTPWHLKGRYQSRFQMYSKVAASALFAGLLAGVVLAWIGGKAAGYKVPDKGSVESSEVDKEIKLTGYTVVGPNIIGTLSDGRTVQTTEYVAGSDGLRVKLGGKWYSTTGGKK